MEVAIDESNPTVLIVKSKDLSDRSFPIGLKCKSVEQAKTWLDNLTRIPAAEEDEQEKAEEQSLIERDDLFMNVNAAASEEVKPPEKVDENNNLAKAKKAASKAATELAESSDSTTAATSETTSSALDSSTASLESASKSTAGNANAEAMEDSTEATTAPTDNLRSESLSSVDGEYILKTTFIVSPFICTPTILPPRGGHLQMLPLLFLPCTDMYSLMEESDSFHSTAPENVGKVIARTASKKMKVSRSTEVPTASLKIAQPLKALTRHGME